MSDSFTPGEAPWWAQPEDLAYPDKFVDVGCARVHPKTAILVDDRIRRYESAYLQLGDAIDRACRGVARDPWVAVQPCGSGIRTAFQPHPPDLDTKAGVFFSVSPDECVATAASELGMQLVPRIVEEIANSEALRAHCLHLSWIRPSANQVLTSTFDALPPAAQHLWDLEMIANGEQHADGQRLALRDGLGSSWTWSFVLAVDAAGCPVSMDLELMPIAIDRTTRNARGILAGYKTSTVGRALMRSADAFGCRAIERRAITEHRLKPVANLVRDLVGNARSLYLGRDYSRSLKLLIEPTAAAGRTDLLEVLRIEVNSAAWLSRGASQALRAVVAFGRDGTMPSAWVDDRLTAILDRIDEIASDVDDPADRPCVERLAELGGAVRSGGWTTLEPKIRDAVLGAIVNRTQARARAAFRDHPDLLGHWYGLPPG